VSANRHPSASVLPCDSPSKLVNPPNVVPYTSAPACLARRRESNPVAPPRGAAMRCVHRSRAWSPQALGHRKTTVYGGWRWGGVPRHQTGAHRGSCTPAHGLPWASAARVRGSDKPTDLRFRGFLLILRGGFSLSFFLLRCQRLKTAPRTPRGFL
jgi:hypothetical protein